jgi:hypothetical protein
VRGLYAALVHHPVRDRSGATITTAITNLDVHDLARTSRTFDLDGFFVVTPVLAQRQIAEAILHHWRDGGPGQARVPERTVALARCAVVDSVEEACAAIADRHGAAPRRVATAARALPGVAVTPFDQAARRMAEPGAPWLVLFGTGHGLTDPLIEGADLLLPPVRPGDYNHLSVRAAAAIILDRLHPREG